ncbi:MAG TPA: hypothetical protein VE442_02650 [Jatrophihabitans sp.]|jgi:hypothetical protein|nr:hypothetical protein [Jatrophihabitans sp.]
MDNAPRTFSFAFEDRYRLPALLFGVTPERTGIVIDAGQLRVRFGLWRIATELSNITSVTATGPYRFLKTAGPARLAVTDRGLTFATNSQAGVEMTFATPIRGIDPAGVIRHPNLTLTPDDVAGFAAALAAPGSAP